MSDSFINQMGLRGVAQLSVLVAWVMGLGAGLFGVYAYRGQRKSWIFWLDILLAGLLVVVPVLFVAGCFLISVLLGWPIF